MTTLAAETLALDQFAERAYLEYAMSVVRGRALPEVADGQKPVQRRILYAMQDMGLSAGAKPVKSARVVGEILGKFHPHGDASAYEALVRMAQDFTLRYPLIDGQGNFGSRDGDGAAAMRYTEARLTPIAQLLLAELNQGTVDFRPNYDGAFTEPCVLPARLPMVLLNGASGIAVGLATEIPPHNLRETAAAAIALLKNPALNTAELLAYLPAPDFAGGGQITNSADELRACYENGRGSIRVRARWHVEPLARNQWRIIVTELPPQISARKILAEIEDLTNPKLRGNKKQLTAEQHNLKTLFLTQLDRVRDESDQTQPVRLVFEPKSSKQSPDEFMNLLLARTSLEISVPMNLVMLGLDGRPQQKNLREILGEWLQFRMETVSRRLAHRLQHVMQRLHILEGRLTVFLHLESVIQLIRESDTPKPELMQTFGLSATQADDILDIRLRQLARLEGLKLEKERTELNAEAEQLNQLLNHDTQRKQLIIREIQHDAKTFGDDRRTELRVTEKAAITQNAPDEALTIIVSQQGWIRSRAGHSLDLSNLSFKEGDSLALSIETRTIWPLVALDEFGRTYTLDSATLPGGRSEGVPLSSLIDLQNRAALVGLMTGTPTQRYLITSSGGYGFIGTLKDAASRVRSGKAYLTVAEHERALPPIPLPTTSDHAPLYVVAVSSDSRALAFPLTELREMPRGRGLQYLPLDAHQSLQAVHVTADSQVALAVLLRSGRIDRQKLALHDYYAPRGRRGRVLPKAIKLLNIEPF